MKKFVFLLALIFTIITGCDNSTEPKLGSGSLKIYLVDSPASFDSVIIFVKRVEVHSSDISAWHIINNTLRSFDLLQLRNGASAVLGDSVLPSGNYTMLRLILGDGSYVIFDGIKYNLTIPSGVQTGIKLNHAFTVEPNTLYELLLDFNVDKSIHKTGNGEYKLEPVIKVMPLVISESIEPVPPTFAEDFSDGDYNGWTVLSGAFSVDNSASNPLAKNQYSLKCDKAGIIYIDSSQAYGRWEFDLYKGLTTNVLGLCFKTDVNGLYSGTGYEFQFVNTTQVANFNRRIYNIYWALFHTASSYVANKTWYRVRMDRTTDGEFSLYIKGGSFGSDFTLIDVAGGGGTNPVTDNILLTTLPYFLIDIDAGDRVSNIAMYNTSY
jgi:hypothetical protein